ncbi:hypothetical protein BU26DRAFT_294769 [Trematosphaeria pertusa]|uniref:Uncharacterized protein n=1 Tax=Trematosphaeria pertusa TaxID=390896 RepID=A0A6A6IKN2_9PLEO|nr:uncharacterized protein BU26DRAFT_294769 [Trematosphaeria pertusa]KAF2250043.1 hypothetical protein BU26DRAFT_294769 [Trematosphaeria pertusa]
MRDGATNDRLVTARPLEPHESFAARRTTSCRICATAHAGIIADAWRSSVPVAALHREQSEHDVGVLWRAGLSCNATEGRPRRINRTSDITFLADVCSGCKGRRSGRADGSLSICVPGAGNGVAEHSLAAPAWHAPAAATTDVHACPGVSLQLAVAEPYHPSTWNALVSISHG